MRVRLAALILLAALPAPAHRLDEYLQATLISVEQDRVTLEMRLVPGVAVLPAVLAAIDTDSNGLISAAEQRGYAERVLRGLTLQVDGRPERLRLTSLRYPEMAEMKDGLGEIQLTFEAQVPRGGSRRKLVFENHHQSRIAAYLVNCLAPRDPAIQIQQQRRNYEQSFYELDYTQPRSFPDALLLVGGAGLLLLIRVAQTRFPRGGPA